MNVVCESYKKCKPRYKEVEQEDGIDGYGPFSRIHHHTRKRNRAHSRPDHSHPHNDHLDE